MVTPSLATCLEALGKLYKAFNVCKEHGDPDQASITDAIELLNIAQEFTESHVESAKTATLNGHQGTISHKTKQSLDILASGLHNIKALLEGNNMIAET